MSEGAIGDRRQERDLRDETGGKDARELKVGKGG